MIHQNEEEEIENLKQKLIDELEFIPTDGLSTYESILLGDEKDIITFDEYLNRLQKTLKKCTCQASCINHTLIIHCLDCQKTKNSCICVPCFLKGNHQGHKLRITHSSNATCDCGDPILWSEAGFCSDHPGPEPNPELTQLDRDTRIKLIAVLKAAFHYYLDFASFNKTFFLNVTEWLFRLVSLGDATRRCVCIAMRDSFEFIDLYTHCLNFCKADLDKLLKFLGSLTNDNVFRQYFSSSVFRFLPKFIWINHRVALENSDPKEPPLVSINQLFCFTFHASSSALHNLLRDSVIDWPKILNESVHLLVAYSFSQMSRTYNDNSRRSITFYRILGLFKSAIAVFGSENQDIIKFVENLAEIFISKEFSFPLTRVFGEKLNDPNKTQDVVFTIYFDIFHFISKIASFEIYTTKPLEILSNFFNSKTFQSIDKEYKSAKTNLKMNQETNIKEKEIKEQETKEQETKEQETNEQEMISLNDDHSFNELFENSIYYHSVLSPEVQFAQTFPTHILAFKCLNLKDGKKNLREYISNVSENVDEFIRKWALLPLRWLVASDLSEYQLFVRNSQNALIAFHSFKFKKNIKYKFVPIFSLLQNLLKITNNVDDFLLMIISTYGFFEYECHDESVNTKENNQLDDNQIRLCLLSIFHFISCLIFDTLCSENNFFTMRHLAVISKLMKGNLSIDEINSIWFNTNEKYTDDLQSFASKTGDKFHLTDNSEWHPLLPYLSLSSIIPLIQEFIHKNPDSLIKFPNLPQENQRILFSPILWALEYHILTRKACKDYQIIHQLIFNVLIITSNNSESFYKNSVSSDFDSDDDSILYASDFIDLYSKLKKMKFEQFLKKKIIYNIKPKSASFNESFPEDNALSLVDIIINLGNIGLTVLERMNISNIINKSPSKDFIQNEERNEKNHKRANNLKTQIINSFKEKQKLFASATTQFEEPTESVEKVECSICHVENQKDYFVFPALIYKSPLSSYLKWRFKNAKLVNNKEEQSEQNDFSDIPESFDLFTTVRTCMHPIHSQCIQQNRYACPADRCPRNASLPIIAGVYNYQKITDKSFKKGINKFVTKAYYNDIKYAVLSIASDIEILEMRHRSNPGCLDNVTIAATLRNVYLCIWHAMHDRAQKILAEEEFKRRRKLVFNAVKKELNKISDESENDLTWSELRERLLKYYDLPEIDPTKSIDCNVRNIMSILLHLKNKNEKTESEKTESETKQDKKQSRPANIIQALLNEIRRERARNENNDDDDDDDDFDDFDGEAIDRELDLQSMLNHEDDVENSIESEYEMYYDEKGRMTQRKWIYLSPLMKYILFSMDADNESDSNVEINMENFIKGHLLSKIVADNDREIKREDDDDFFRDTDTINDLSTDYKMLQFLRCAAIFDHFARGQEITQKVNEKESNDNEDKKQTKNDNEFIDWDVILSPSYLNSHYKIFQNKEKNEFDDEHVLPMFSFINVPQNFLDFIHPPYSAPILTSDEGNLSLCLLTGKVVLLPSQPQANPDQMKLEVFLKKVFNKSFDIFLNLNGNGASLVVVASVEFNIIIPCQSFYVDEFGDKDIGMKRGSLLYVSDSKREEIIDNFLSGTWANSFKWPWT